MKKKKRHLKKRYKFLIFTILLFTVVGLWSCYISTSGLVIREYKVVNNNLPSSFDGLKIVHFTDVHYGRTIDNERLTHLVEEINALKPDLIFFTGDLVDKDTIMTPKMKNDIVAILSKLEAHIGKYAIRGNHDLYFTDYDTIINDSGFTNLTNTYDIIYSKNYEPIYIAGLESKVKGHPNIGAITSYINDKNEDGTSVNEVPKYKILILHTPDTIDKIGINTFDLVLAGHSHNGQVRLPFIGAIITPVGAKKYYNEYYQLNNTPLYISGGLGTSNANFRLFNKPSFNFYRLTTK